MEETKSYPDVREDWCHMEVALDSVELSVGGWQVMQAWERPLMARLAREVTRNAGDILEIGFGMGISANEIAACGCDSYTVIEAHPRIADMARDWCERQPFPASVIEGFWQDAIEGIGQQFDGILFDTYPLSAMERGQNHFEFIPHAPALLKDSGILTLYSDETIEFRTAHMALLLASFAEVRLVRVDDLRPPDGCEYWQSSTMVIPVASRPRG